MKLRRVATATGVTLAAMLSAGAAPAFASTLVVHQPTDTKCGDGSPYVTIQSAVDAAQPGDRVAVCPGTYTEQVTVPAGKDNITLYSISPWRAVIQAPPAIATSPSGAIVDVNGAQDTGILRFTIEGPGPANCASIQYGVYVEHGGSADIEGNHITQIEDTPFGGCQNGVAVEVGQSTSATTGSATVAANVIDNYQKNGVTVDNTGSSGQIDGNVIRGAGPTTVIAQNGVQISDGASADVASNWISGNVYSPQTYASTGVLLYAPTSTYVEHNNVSSSDIGIYAYQVDRHTTVANNQVSGSTFDGITVESSTGGQIDANNSSDNTGPFGEGFGVYTTTGARFENDQADENATNGFYAGSDTSGNVFSSGEAHGNRTFDCEDDSVGAGTAHTANLWIDDRGVTSQPMGICHARQRGDGGHDHEWHPRPDFRH